jgi:hypothetical protein
MSWEAQPIEEDLEPIDDAEPLDEVEVASPGYGPSLEPPTPPDELDAAQRRSVDVWALSAEDEVEAPAPVAARRAPTPAPIPTFDDEPVDELMDEPVDAPEPELEPEPLAPAVSRLADTLAAPLASAAASAVPAGLPHAELVRLAREVLEQIAWEVVLAACGTGNSPKYCATPRHGPRDPRAHRGLFTREDLGRIAEHDAATRDLDGLHRQHAERGVRRARQLDGARLVGARGPVGGRVDAGDEADTLGHRDLQAIAHAAGHAQRVDQPARRGAR